MRLPVHTVPPAPKSSSLLLPLKQAIVAQVVAVFNDQAKGEQPVVRRDDGLFGPGSVAWRVHGDVASMMIGGISGLLLQMLHPAVLAGVWDHSNFRADMHGRLRRTARFIAITTYSDKAAATAMIQRIRGIHDQVSGILPGGASYCANDPALLAWVHVTEAVSFLDAWIRYAEPRMSRADQDRYFDEVAQVGIALGAEPVPRTRTEARKLIGTMRPQLRCDERTREVARLILNRRLGNRAAEPLLALTMKAAIDLLPAWAGDMHGLNGPALSLPLIRAGAFGMAETVRWAFQRGPAYRSAPAEKPGSRSGGGQH